MRASLMVVAAICVFLPQLQAGEPVAEWPCFHGPGRDNKSVETGLLKTWPAGGPKLLWTASGLGKGYSSVSIADGLIYTAGMVEKRTYVFALDLDGNKVWTRTNGKAWKKSYPGTRCTPTIVDGLLHHLSGIGNLVCLRADSGDLVWSKNILEEFGGRNIIWGLAESPLVVDNKVICTPGGEDISMAALDRKTGKVVWTCAGVGDKPGYASPIPIDHQGLQQIVTGMSESVG